MTAYYNEIDPYAAQWLRNLIAAGHIAPGDVDERDIRDITPNELKQYTQCHFFAGVGVWSLALRNAGWPDSRPVWTGSCPCQPFSSAGRKAGVIDERHLWPHWFHLIEECRPSRIFGEQVASKDGLGWLDLVQADLEGADTPMQRSIYALRASVRRISDKDSGSWPSGWATPQAFDATNNGLGRAPRLKKDGKRDPNNPGSYRGELKDWAVLAAWPTPTTTNNGKGEEPGAKEARG